jgi:hypothetical protein
VFSVEEPIWFSNSYSSIPELEYADVDLVDAQYEKKFNVRLIYGEPPENETMRPIMAVEFPSEADAMLFMLRWS